MRDFNENNVIYGRNPVYETLTRAPKKIEKIFVKDNYNHKDFAEIFELAKQNKIPFSTVPERKINDVVGDAVHQGIYAVISQSEYLSFDEWKSNLGSSKNNVVLVLDQIEDTHNFGAIIRSAAAFGVSAIFVSKHNQAPVNGTVYKTSAGMINVVPIVRVSNINDVIEKLKDLKFWVAGLDGESNKNIFDEDLQYSIAFVVGNEGNGISSKTKEHCDMLIKIPMSNGVESLNASVSTAISLYEWKRQNF